MSHQAAAKRMATVAFATIAFTSLDAAAGDHSPKPSDPFEVATINVEQNATDGDTEVVMTALAGDEGLRMLRIRTPDRRLVVNARSPDPSVMGQREFAFESPEPEGEAILAAYPEGWYTFEGTSVTGERFRSRARLSHQLPAATVILHPAQDAEVGVDSLTIRWSAVPGSAQYVIELENESADPEQVLTFNVPPSQTEFEAPRSLLVPGADYQVGIAVIGGNGNVVVTETTFTTAED
jgi:hypothetical protein